MIDRIFTAAERDNTLKDAYALVAEIDVLDTSQGGSAAWETAKKAYNEKVDRLESQIIAKLRDELGAARGGSTRFWGARGGSAPLAATRGESTRPEAAYGESARLGAARGRSTRPSGSVLWMEWAERRTGRHSRPSFIKPPRE